MHELGHLVGLGHVPMSDQLMYEDHIGQRAFGAGDREGLRQLGLGPCFTNSAWRRKDSGRRQGAGELPTSPSLASIRVAASRAGASPALRARRTAQ